MLVLIFVACRGDAAGEGLRAGSGGAATGGAGSSAAGTVGQSGNAAAGQGGSSSDAPNKGAVALQFAAPTCIARTTWALPDPDAPVTATEQGTLAVDGGLYFPRVRCLVSLDGSLDLEARILLSRQTAEISVNVFARDPAMPSEGGIQLMDPSLGPNDISSTAAGPCLFSFIELSDGNAWGKVECAATKKRDLTDCGAATIYFAFADCFTDRAAYLGRR